MNRTPLPCCPPRAGLRRRPRAGRSIPRLLAATLPCLLAPLLASPATGSGMSSPWWEDYGVRTRYLCRDRNLLVVERNDAQASLISGRFRTTLFRETSDLPGLRYTADDMRLILNGDELTLERLPMRLQCLRTEEV